MSNSSDLTRFIALFLVLLLPCFLLWALVSPWLAWPAVWLSDVVLTAWMPNVVEAVYLSGSKAVVATYFTEVNGVFIYDAKSEEQIGFAADTRLLSYSIPFYAALHFATRPSGTLARFGMGFWVLFPLIVFGLICVSLKNLMVGLGAAFFAQDAMFVPGGHFIGISYQLSVLIIPCVAPLIVWVGQSHENTLFEPVNKLRNLSSKPRDDGFE